MFKVEKFVNIENINKLYNEDFKILIIQNQNLTIDFSECAGIPANVIENIVVNILKINFSYDKNNIKIIGKYSHNIEKVLFDKYWKIKKV